MLSQGIIWTEAKGQSAPKSWLEHVTEMFPTCSGLAVVMGTDLIVDRLSGKTTVASLETLQAKTKDELVVYHMANYPEGIPNEDDFQPFSLLMNEKDEPMLVGFAEGTWTDVPDSAHTQEWQLMNGVIMPRCTQTFKLVGNLDKLMEWANDPITKNDFFSTSKGRGTIILLGLNKKAVIHSDNNDEFEFDWGYVSRTDGFGEESVVLSAPAVVIPPKKTLSLSGGDDKAVELAARRAASPPTGLAAIEAIAAKAPQGPVSKIEDKPTELVKKTFTCPANVIGKDNIRNEYLKHAGWVPQSYKKKPTVEVRLEASGEPIKSLQDLSVTKVGATTVIHNQTALTTGNPLGEEPVPVIDAEKKKTFHTGFMNRPGVKKLLDKSSQQIVDPKAMQAFESKYPTFPAIAGLKNGLDDIDTMVWAEFIDLGRNHGDLCALLAFNLRNDRMRLKAAVNKPADAITADKKTEETVVIPTKKRISL